MYRIFLKEKTIDINTLDNGSKYPELPINNFQSAEELINFIKENKAKRFQIISEHPEKSFQTIKSLFKNVISAGGIVYNTDFHILMIYRRGKWDLPKGKTEEGEEVRTSAIREVQEECGIGMLRILQHFMNTFHIYQEAESYVLKETFWFEMISTDTGTPKPQIEEGIQDVAWMSLPDALSKMDNSYGNIKVILKKVSEEGYLLDKI